tara:strand:+ start:17254 stop:18441 length:1188 start_codon:yes stop_codon:yes gene_type:complete
MFVNKYTIVNSELSGTTGQTINLFTGQNQGLTGQQELIETKFVETEVDKAVNVIYDYEKIKLLPICDNTTTTGTTMVTDIIYNVNLLETESSEISSASLTVFTSLDISTIPPTISTTTATAIETSKKHNLKLGEKIVILSPLSNIFNKEFLVKRLGLIGGTKKDTVFVIDIPPTSSNLALINSTASKSSVKRVSNLWSDIGFDYNDFLFKKKAFTKTFLNLDFYDSDISTTQSLISFITLYPKFSQVDLALAGQGNTPDPKTYQLKFELGNTVLDRTRNGEGFSLYHFKDEILPKPLPPKYLYMKAKFNNAKNGISTGLMSSNNPNLSIDKLMLTTMNTIPIIKNNLYTRYILIRDINGYFYKIDTDYSNNVTPVLDTSGVNYGYNIELYQTSTT